MLAYHWACSILGILSSIIELIVGSDLMIYFRLLYPESFPLNKPTIFSGELHCLTILFQVVTVRFSHCFTLCWTIYQQVLKVLSWMIPILERYLKNLASSAAICVLSCRFILDIYVLLTSFRHSQRDCQALMFGRKRRAIWLADLEIRNELFFYLF